ncbi:MAG: SH3 domain-containing protein [Gallionella sp.]|nr:SH3 domain-containing protein [Gallionella sp.]
MKPYTPRLLVALASLIAVGGLPHTVSVAYAADYVSVGESNAILYDAPSLKAKKLFVVNRYMPFEQIVTLDNWVKVRDRSGALYWVEKRALSSKRYVFALPPLLDVRAEPDSGAARLFQVRQQVALERLESTGTGWIKVRHQDADVGYVPSAEVWGD